MMLDRIQKWLPIVTLHIIFFALPLIFTASTDELFEFPKILVVYAAAILLVFSWVLQSLMQKKARLPQTSLWYPVAAFLVSQMISTVFSINVHTSLFGYYSRFNGGLFSVLSYIVLFAACTLWITKDNIWSMIRSILIGAILAALYAFPEHFGHSPSCLLLTGQFTADCWIQDVQTRVFGTLGQPNWLAALMVVVLPLAVVKIQITDYKRKLLQKIGWVITFVIFCLVLLYTKSRSGILGAGLALGLQALFSIIFEWKTKSAKKMRKSALFSMFSIVFVVLVLLIANPVRDKLEQLIHLPSLSQSPAASSPPATGTQLDIGGSESGDIRKVVWSGALKVWLRYPIFGSGVETFAYSYYKDRPKEHNLLSEWDFLYNKAHNEFLNYLATTGAVGLITYVLMYGSFIVFPIFWATRSNDLPTTYFLLSTSAALAGLAVSNFFGFSTVVVSALTFVFPALATVSVGKVKFKAIDIQIIFRKKIITRLCIAALFLVTGYLLSVVYTIYSVDTEYAQSKSLIDHQEVETGVALLQSVVDASPYEPVYRDELAYTAARLSYALGATGDSTSSARLAQAAIDHSDEVLTQNHVNVNFYKTRARIFTLLGQISPVFYKQAIETLEQARELSPTDPKLTYNLALVAKAQGNMTAYEKNLKDTLDLRPIDIQARLDLAKLYEDEKRTDDAKREYAAVLQLDSTNANARTRIASLSATKKK